MALTKQETTDNFPLCLTYVSDCFIIAARWRVAQIRFSGLVSFQWSQFKESQQQWPTLSPTFFWWWSWPQSNVTLELSVTSRTRCPSPAPRCGPGLRSRWRSGTTARDVPEIATRDISSSLREDLLWLGWGWRGLGRNVISVRVVRSVSMSTLTRIKHSWKVSLPSRRSGVDQIIFRESHHAGHQICGRHYFWEVTRRPELL